MKKIVLLIMIVLMSFSVSAAYTSDLTPAMSTYSQSHSGFTYVVIHSGDSSGIFAYEAFDHQHGTDDFWRNAGTPPQYVGMDFGSGNSKTVTKYTVRSRNDLSGIDAHPKSWNFQGSNDNSVWTTLHSRTNEGAWTPNLLRTYTFSNSNAYRYYRLYITANQGDARTYVAEIEMMEIVIVCGNGVVEGSEVCDDGDTSSGDGCSATCTIELGWDCNGEPSVCLEEYSITEPVGYGGGMDLTDTNGNSIDSTTTKIALQIRDGLAPKVEFSIDGNVDLSLISVDADSSRTVVANLGGLQGVTGTHSLFVSDTGTGVFICPDATSLGDVVIGCSNVVTIASCPGSSGAYSCADEGSYFKVTGLTGSGVGTTCNDCADCDTGLYCDLRDGTPTCKNSTLVAAVDCVDCVDNDADALIDLDDPGCAGSSSGTSEVDGGGATIPEFNFVGYLLILVIAGIGLYFISRK